MSICPSCNNDNLTDNNFCVKCGAELFSATGRLSNDTLLENRYIIVEILGRGGMGAVYKALDSRLNDTPVAIKEMSSSALGPGKLKEAVEAFEKEACMLITLRNPSLPRITDFFSQGKDRWYLVMDYIEGETLESIAKRRGAIAESEVLLWAKQLCEVLDFLHSQNPPIIFRDLKPSNIMLTPNNEIKLIDFGIARHFKPGVTTDTSYYGSTGFSPPEQYGEGQTDARSDIYGLGVTLHYLLTGKDPSRKPFQFETPSDTVTISPELEKAIMQAVEFKQEKRPSSVKEFMEMLPEENDKLNSSSETEAYVLQNKHDETMRMPVPKAARKKSAALLWGGAVFFAIFASISISYGMGFWGENNNEQVKAEPEIESVKETKDVAEAKEEAPILADEADEAEAIEENIYANELYITNVEIDSFLFLRKSYGTENKPDSDIIERFPKGWVFEVIDKHENNKRKDNYTWWEVKDPVSGNTGWVAATFLNKLEDQTFSRREFGLENIGLHKYTDLNDVIDIMGTPIKDQAVEGMYTVRELRYDGLKLGFLDNNLVRYKLSVSDYVGPRKIQVGDTADAVLNKYLKDYGYYPGDLSDPDFEIQCLYYIEEVDNDFVKAGYSFFDKQTEKIKKIEYAEYIPATCAVSYVRFIINDGKVSEIIYYY